MKSMRKLIAFVLSVMVVLGMAFPAAAVTDGYKDADQITYKEAVDILSVIGVLQGNGAYFSPKGNLTREQAAKLIAMFDNGSAEVDAAYAESNTFEDSQGRWSDVYVGYCAEKRFVAGNGNNQFSPENNVLGVEFLKMTLTIVGYDAEKENYMGEGWAEEVLADAKAFGLLNGLVNFDATVALSREQAAQIMLNAFRKPAVAYEGGKTVYTRGRMSDKWGVKNEGVRDYPDIFNRPGSKWVSADTGEDLTGVYLATPMMVFGEATPWKEIMNSLGHRNNGQAVTFQNTGDGGEYTVRFDVFNTTADSTGDTGLEVEIYKIGENEYRNIYKNVFLAYSDQAGLTCYGFGDQVWGPWPDTARPPHGYYLINYFWNVYGQGEGYRVIQEAETIRGTLDAIGDKSLTVNGQVYLKALNFNLGSSLVNAEEDIGKGYTFFLDHYNHIIGCVE